MKTIKNICDWIRINITLINLRSLNWTEIQLRGPVFKCLIKLLINEKNLGRLDYEQNFPNTRTCLIITNKRLPTISYSEYLNILSSLDNPSFGDTSANIRSLCDYRKRMKKTS